VALWVAAKALEAAGAAKSQYPPSMQRRDSLSLDNGLSAHCAGAGTLQTRVDQDEVISDRKHQPSPFADAFPSEPCPLP
jgi:hypothetical protein